MRDETIVLWESAEAQGELFRVLTEKVAREWAGEADQWAAEVEALENRIADLHEETRLIRGSR